MYSAGGGGGGGGRGFFWGMSNYLERDKGVYQNFGQTMGWGEGGANFFLHLLKKKHYFVFFFYKRRPS